MLLNGAMFFADVQSDPDKAIDFFEKVIAVVPEHPLAFERLGEALAMRGRAIRLYLNELEQADKALVHLEELLRANPADDGALYLTQQMPSNKNLAPRAASLLAGAYDRAGNHGEAVKDPGLKARINVELEALADRAVTSCAWRSAGPGSTSARAKPTARDTWDSGARRAQERTATARPTPRERRWRRVRP